MRFAYADPPYIGYSRYYRDDPNCAEVDHNELLKKLCAEYDGWALSCYTNSLTTILRYPNCPEDIRIGAWVKPWASFKPGVNPGYAWEPILFYGGRKRHRTEIIIRDWVAVNGSLQNGLIGAKPIKLCYWIFKLLNALPEDEFDDLFPGSGIVGKAWKSYCDKKKHKQLEMING